MDEEWGLSNSSLERLLRHDRRIVAGALLLVTVLCWAWIVAGAGMGMSGIEMTRHTRMGMDMMPVPDWDGAYFTLMFFMWWIMMIAMMLPSATPVILLTAAVNRRNRTGSPPFGSSASFTAGYLLAWAVFSLLAVIAQWGLLETGGISGMLRSRHTGLTAAILIAAGAWQFSPWKYACLKHCRAPVEFLSKRNRPGNTGALLMGAEHGLYCLGCCWFLMLLLFVGGVMNLLWIAGLAVYVWIEKILPPGETVSRVTGALLITWGVATAAAPLYT
jgi:predicted metal-binding membrane protein